MTSSINNDDNKALENWELWIFRKLTNLVKDYIILNILILNNNYTVILDHIGDKYWIIKIYYNNIKIYSVLFCVMNLKMYNIIIQKSKHLKNCKDKDIFKNIINRFWNNEMLMIKNHQQ